MNLSIKFYRYFFCEILFYLIKKVFGGENYIMKKTKIIALNINCKSSHIMSGDPFSNSKGKYFGLKCGLNFECPMEEKKENIYELLFDWGVL